MPPKARPSTAAVYRHVIDETLAKARTEFVQEGVEECVAAAAGRRRRR
jgi:hypothetical protein